MELKLTGYQTELYRGFVESVTFHKVGKKTTVALLTVDNGFEIVGTSACVNPDDFNEKIGNHYALANALDKLDSFVGFAKQEEAFQKEGDK
jgi:hypothetical protein